MQTIEWVEDHNYIQITKCTERKHLVFNSAFKKQTRPMYTNSPYVNNNSSIVTLQAASRLMILLPTFSFSCSNWLIQTYILKATLSWSCARVSTCFTAQLIAFSSCWIWKLSIKLGARGLTVSDLNSRSEMKSWAGVRKGVSSRKEVFGGI